jgi:UDP-N-acetylglucosamine 2-epimerase (non-hydrolysing)
MSPVVRACEGVGLDWFMIHTGQHYSYSVDRVFFEQLELPDVKYNPDVVLRSRKLECSDTTL